MSTCQHINHRTLIGAAAAGRRDRAVPEAHPGSSLRLDGSVAMQDDRPLYRQVKEHIRERIGAGEWPDGWRIPTQHELCDSLQVSRITVARALQELIQEGLLVSRQGVGTFVTAMRRPTRLTNVAELYRRTFGEAADGGQHMHRLLGVGSCNGEDAPSGFFARDRELWHATRLRVIAERPVSFEEAYIDKRYVPDGVEVRELEATLLHDFLTQRCGARVRSTQVQIGAGRLTESQARLLQAQIDDPALLIRRVATDVEGNVVAVSENVHPTNTYTYYFEFEHEGGLT